MTQRTEVIVIGGGQAGLAAGYYLSRARIPFVILDANPRIGDSWRNRWDSLTLFTAARYSSLPGLRFPGNPDHFPGKDEVADYVERYARTFELPVRLGHRVHSLNAAPGGYQVTTSAGDFEAAAVIVATGAYQRPRIPAVAADLADDVVQMHSSQYRNADQLPGGTVVVVGGANSGAGIARDLARSHRVALSQGSRLRSLPRRLLGKPLHWWAEALGLITAPLKSPRGQYGELLIGASMRRLSRRHGVELAGRTVAAHGRTVRFEDGREVEADAVVWATGFSSDYSWIDVPGVLYEQGEPRHRRGVTAAKGLYFVGMKGQYSRGSSLIHWVRHDAEYIVDEVRAFRPASPRPDGHLHRVDPATVHAHRTQSNSLRKRWATSTAGRDASAPTTSTANATSPE